MVALRPPCAFTCAYRFEIGKRSISEVLLTLIPRRLSMTRDVLSRHSYLLNFLVGQTGSNHRVTVLPVRVLHAFS